MAKDGSKNEQKKGFQIRQQNNSGNNGNNNNKNKGPVVNKADNNGKPQQSAQNQNVNKNGSTAPATNGNANNNSNINGADKSKQAENKAAIEKVNKQMATENDDTLIAKVIGLGLIILGLVFIALAVVVVILSRREPEVDSDIKKPSIKVSKEYTNDDSVMVSGTSDDGKEAIVWVNGDLEDKGVEVKDKKFEYEVKLKDEGEYTIEAAAVKGFPLRKRSEKSDAVKVIVDRTKPSTELNLEYSKTPKKAEDLVVKGTSEPNSTIVLKNKKSNEEVKVEADDKGKFELKGIKLEKGENVFDIIVRDRAGNESILADGVKTTLGGDLNGDGASNGGNGSGNNGGSTGGATGGNTSGGTAGNGNLPESAGELDDALNFLLGNNLMLMFGLLAIGVFTVNSGVVAYRLKR